MVRLVRAWRRSAIKNDLAVQVELMRFGSPTLSVSETWRVPGVAAAVREHAGGAGSSAGVPGAGDAIPGPRPVEAIDIGEAFAKRQSLVGEAIVVRGRVVKATHGVFGANWYHLRDGTGDDGSSDLTVTSDDSVDLGDIVTARGVVVVDRDLGFGYFYPLLLDNASLQ